MSNIQKNNDIKAYLTMPAVKQRFAEVLGERANSFLISVLQSVMSNNLLQNADPQSIYGAAMAAALMDLPVNANLGYAYIVPYSGVAQFQLGYKGLTQLALRSGQFLKINATDVREGEIVSRNLLTGDIVFNWLPDAERQKAKVIGYASYFKLINGYESIFYMSVDEVKAHAKKYSKAYQRGSGMWAENFDGMALKTVTKLNLSRKAPLSVQMQRAMMLDQSVTNDGETPTYIDNNEAVEVDEAKLIEQIKPTESNANQ